MKKTKMVSKTEKMKCPYCKGLMEESVELIICNGRTIPQNVRKCVKCGKAIVSIDEYERTRQEMNPSLLARFKGLFKANTKFVNVSKGKVL